MGRRVKVRESKGNGGKQRVRNKDNKEIGRAHV